MRCALVCVLFAGISAHAAEYTYVHAEDRAHVLCGTAAESWRDPSFDDSSWPERELDTDGGMAGCQGTMFVRIPFDVGAELPHLATLSLRIRYSHGFAAYLNGVEIARRRIDANASQASLANDVHGPEADRLFIPVRPGLLRQKGNLIAVEVHPRTLGREPFADLELVGADGVRIVRGPYLVRLSEREVTIAFDTDLPAFGEVRWGPTDAYGRAASDAPAQTHHALKLTGLKPGTTTHYRVLVRPQPGLLAQAEGLPAQVPVDSGDAIFHTPPEVGKPLRFVVYGDVRSGHEVHAAINQKILEEDPDLALMTGDLVDRGSDEGDWERFFEVAGPLLRQVAIFPTLGNHDYARLGHGFSVFQSLFRWPLRAGEDDAGWYSFDAAGVHFVAVDSNQYHSPRQLTWLDRDLAEAHRKRARAIFVYSHEPPYSTAMHGDNSTAIHDYVPLLERHKVSMYFGGHDHDYERGRVGTLDYVVTGGGGAELRNPRCGIPGKKACPPHVLAFYNEHHYVTVEVLPAFFRVCPKRPDGSALEPCTEYPLKR
jgi:hypothetical protein